MIITKLTGGLGNQMFQYAAGYALAKKLNTDLSLDLSYYSNLGADTGRHFSLDIFNISARPANDKLITTCLNLSPFIKLNKLINRFNLNPRLIKEAELFVFHEIDNLDARKNYYLDGYWQNAKYFQVSRSELLREFSLAAKSNPFLSNLSLKELIGSSGFGSSVGIHIRRGDYIDSAYRPEEENKCIFFGLDYYREAVAVMRQKVLNPLWLIFSDDPVWVKENIAGLDLTASDNIIFADQYQLQDYDLLLMSYCHHQIIANSTFSWWSAWLNSAEDKIVIGPKRWSKSSSLDTSDILPKSWLRL